MCSNMEEVPSSFNSDGQSHLNAKMSCSSESSPNKSKTGGGAAAKSGESNLQLATTTPNAPVKVATVPSIIPSSQNNECEAHKVYNNFNSTAKPKNVASGGADPVDFIGPSNAVRHLFSLPYSTDKNVSVALHTLGNGTILLDSGEVVADSPFAFGASDDGEGAAASPRPGRRRRPRRWSVENEQIASEKGQGANVQNQLAQAQGEKSLLASLSLLLEEERQMEKSRIGNDVNIIEDLDGEKDKTTIVKSERGIVKRLSSDASEYISEGETVKTKQSNEATLVRSNSGVIGTEISDERKLSFTQSAIVGSSCSDGTNLPVHRTQPIWTMRSSDPNDALADKLHPPNHYLRHIITPPTEPLQYHQWRFKGMNLLVASDAVVYKSNGNVEDTSAPDDSKSLVLKVADASDLRAKMHYHQAMVQSGTCVPNSGLMARKPLPRSSYAEALLKENAADEKEVESGSSSSFDSVKLQTCIIPSFNVGNELSQFGFSISPSPSTSNFNAPASPTQTNYIETTEQSSGSPESSPSLPYSSSPCCTVVDAYLDNIMANVPQLALILREHGFIQNIKLLSTEDIPSLFMHPSTLGDASRYPESTPEPIFSPDVVETNAAMLLRFLKTNCTRENSTYLLHRSAGDTNLQLFDISSISQLRQRKWIWWLALCSYRFACRLEQLQTNVLSPHDNVTRRDYRKRQRSLLHNTLNLLEELEDMDGVRHETIKAAVYEHLADTYLWNDSADGDIGTRDMNKPAPLAVSSQPYGKVTVDCLSKAQDHLTNAISILKPLLAKAKDDNSPMELEAVSMQLYGMHHKIVNVSLRLADHHLQSYFSSNLLQSLRTAARMLSEATSLLAPLNMLGFDATEGSEQYTKMIVSQYSWLFEYCGHFARSFAADELWRERGHTCGNDLISLFREVDSACFSVMRNCFGPEWKSKTIISVASHGQVCLKSLTGIVVLPDAFEEIECSVLQKEGCHEAIRTAKTIVYSQSQIQREACLVLVSATMCYSHAIAAYQHLGMNQTSDSPSFDNAPSLLFQRLGDVCNEIGQILLKSSRQVLVTGLPDEATGRKSSGIEKSHVSAIMLSAAQFWFMEGLEQFNAGRDLRNIALLRCNLCQVCKIRANTNVVLPGSTSDAPNESEQYLQKAVDHLVLAHDALGQRETDPVTWDMVSLELASTLLVLGVRRRQSSLAGATSSSNPLTMKAFRPAPGVEKSIVEPMERSVKIYESLGTALSAQQAAAGHYQLAIYYSKVWTCQRDEKLTREKLASAFNHFGVAHHYYSYHTLSNEPTFVCLSLDFSNLYSAVSDREDCLTKALAICLDCRRAFVPESIASMRNKPNFNEWVSQMETLSTNIQDRVSKLLMSLVKIEKEKSMVDDKYKNMYRQVVTHKILSTKKDSLSNAPPESFGIHDLLHNLAAALGPGNKEVQG